MSASRVEALRKARGWSRLELAALAGVTEHTIIRAERTAGSGVQTRSLVKIASALEVSVGELMGLATDDPAAVPLAPVADPDVLFIQDLARELRSTVRGLRRIYKREPWKLPEPLPSLDRRLRWSRVVVERWLELRDGDRKQRARASRELVGAR